MTDTKTLTTELDNILWIEEEINAIAKSGYDPTIGLLASLKAVDESKYNTVMFAMEKVIKQQIDQLSNDKRQLFQNEVKKLQPLVDCEFIGNNGVKWMGQYTCGLSSDNWIVWHIPSHKMTDSRYFKYLRRYATKTVQTTHLHHVTLVDSRTLVPLEDDKESWFINRVKDLETERNNCDHITQYVCNGVGGLVDTKFNTCQQAELRLVKQFIVENQLSCTQKNSVFSDGYVDIEVM